MAFVILSNGQFYRVAKTQSDVDDINIPEQAKTVVDISDDDFNSFVTYQKEIFVNDGNVTFSDFPETHLQHANEELLKEHFNEFKDLANLYIEKNSDRQLAIAIKNYVTYLDTVDTSSLSYPIKWEKYCSENSIVFFNKYQIG
jgi:hypothetical protein